MASEFTGPLVGTVNAKNAVIASVANVYVNNNSESEIVKGNDTNGNRTRSKVLKLFVVIVAMILFGSSLPLVLYYVSNNRTLVSLWPNETDKETESAAKDMADDLAAWEELASPLRRNELLVFTDRFVHCPQHFVSKDATNPIGGKVFDLDIRKGLFVNRVVLRDVEIEVLQFHSVAPSFMPGLALIDKPIICVNLQKQQASLPWVFHAQLIIDPVTKTAKKFEETQVSIERRDWQPFLLRITANDRGVYKINIYIDIQDDDNDVKRVLVTPRPVFVAFFEWPGRDHPDHDSLRERHLSRGGSMQALLKND